MRGASTEGPSLAQRPGPLPAPLLCLAAGQPLLRLPAPEQAGVWGGEGEVGRGERVAGEVGEKGEEGRWREGKRNSRPLVGLLRLSLEGLPCRPNKPTSGLCLNQPVCESLAAGAGGPAPDFLQHPVLDPSRPLTQTTPL